MVETIGYLPCRLKYHQEWFVPDQVMLKVMIYADTPLKRGEIG